MALFYVKHIAITLDVYIVNLHYTIVLYAFMTYNLKI